MEHRAQEANPRFVVTRLEEDAQKVYDEIYRSCTEMENRIKEQQIGLVADDTSCPRWWTNQFRLRISSSAHLLLETIRRVGLAGSELISARGSSIRFEILKVGTVIVPNTRRIRLFFSSAYPLQDLLRTLLARLSSACTLRGAVSGTRKTRRVGGLVPKSRPNTLFRDSPPSSAPLPTVSCRAV